MFHFSFSKTMVFHIPFRGLGRKIQLKTAPKSPPDIIGINGGDLKLQPYRINASLKNTTLFNF